MLGDIIFVRSSSPISWMIRKLTHSKYSHVAVSLSDDNSLLIESDVLKPVKVRRNSHNDYDVVKLNIDDGERLKLVSFLISKSFVRYDYGRIFGILMNILGLSKNKDLWNDYNKLICSELVGQGLTIINSPNIPKEMKDAITPADIANILIKEQVINQ